MQTWQIIRNLVAQQLAMRYRRAWLGLAWMTLVPLLTMAVMGLAISLIFHVKSLQLVANIVAAYLPFSFFQTAVVHASGSLVGNQDILRRHNVDRIVFPLSAIAVATVEYLTATLSLLVLGPLLGMHFSSALLVVPLGFLCLLTAGVGLGLLGSVGTVYFRDLSHLIQVGFTLLYWLTPIIYRLDMLPERFRPLFYLNPVTPMILLYTEPLVAGQPPPVGAMIAAPLVAGACLLAGLALFRQMSRRIIFAL